MFGTIQEQLVDNFLPSVQVNPQTGMAERPEYTAKGGMGVVSNLTSGNMAMGGGRMIFDPGLRRPYINNKNHLVCNILTGRWTVDKGVRKLVKEEVLARDLINNGMVPMGLVNNATSLRKEEWLELDRVVLREARYRMSAYADLAAANTYGGFNGMAKIALEHETMNDPGEALVDMDGLTEGRTDSPKFQLEGLPLPITHSDFWFSSRFLAMSRNSGTPLDTTMGEAAGRRVAESIEKVTIGTDTGITYTPQTMGTYGRASTVYGYLNFTRRLTGTTGYKPTLLGRSGTGWVASDTLKDVLAIIDALKLNKFYGPYMIYTSNDWDQYLDNDYILTGGNVATQTLRERLKKIGTIQDVKRLDFLTAAESGVTDAAYSTGAHPFRMIVVQMTPDVARAVNGMDITTVQWESVGGMRVNFKVMCIQVPQLRASFAGNCGIADTQFTG